MSMRCVVREPKARLTVYSVFYFYGWEACMANWHRDERGQLALRRSNKNGGLFDSNAFFFLLPLLHKVQTKCNSSKEKRAILTVGASVGHEAGHHFSDQGEVRPECQLLN